jgi:hypothetical protein
VWWRNRVEEPPTPVADLLLPYGVARLIGLVGVVAAVACLLLFLLPGLGIDIWPWMLTPLTARVMGAIFALATVGIAAFRYRRWSGMQILLQVEGLMLVLIAVALVRARDDFAASRPRQAAAVGETRAGRRAVQQGDALAPGVGALHACTDHNRSPKTRLPRSSEGDVPTALGVGAGWGLLSWASGSKFRGSQWVAGIGVGLR